MSVAKSSVASVVAEIFTPERACTAVRVEATRVTVCNWSKRSAVEREIFTVAPCLRGIE
jgi:hypothetical protein